MDDGEHPSERETIRVPPMLWRGGGGVTRLDGAASAWPKEAVRAHDPIPALSARAAALSYARERAGEVGMGEAVVIDVQQEGCDEVEVVTVAWSLEVVER